MSPNIDEVCNQSVLSADWAPIIEIVKCEGCKKEECSPLFSSIAEKWPRKPDSKNFYGRFIYACDDCFDKCHKEFREKMHENGELIIIKGFKRVV